MQYILIFLLALALNEHGLKMPILTTTMFFQSTCWATELPLTSLFVWRTVLDDLFQMVACFYTV